MKPLGMIAAWFVPRRFRGAFTTCACLTLVGLLAGVSLAGAQTAIIGGSIYEGATDGAGQPVTDPAQLVALTVLDDGAAAMVQDMETGDFVVYATVIGNVWTALVPAPDAGPDPANPAKAHYVVMFSATDHDLTSRSFAVSSGDNVTADAYLAPLPLPSANLLAYAFHDRMVNGADDFPADPGLAQVLLEVIDKDGNVVQSGLTGTQSPWVFPPLAGPDYNGLYYFQGLAPGEYTVRATAPEAALPPNASAWYPTTSEEGDLDFEVVLVPGDPGTEAGFYLIWFGFTELLPSSVDPLAPDTGTITGRLVDADGVDPDPADQLPPDLKCVTNNIVVPEGVVILFDETFEGGQTPHAVASALVDNDGYFAITDVPTGNFLYQLYASDLTHDYVFTTQGVNLAPGQSVNIEVWAPRFFARTHGYVRDTNDHPVAGLAVNFRLGDGSVWMSETTDANGWYNFDDLVEVETLGFLEVDPGAVYRAHSAPPTPPVDPANPTCLEEKGKAGNRVVGFAGGLNYNADLYVEPIPAATADIRGFTFMDSLAPAPVWQGDGTWQEADEATVKGVVVNLWDTAIPPNLVATTTSGIIDEADLVAQGYIPAFTTIPMNEFGGIFSGEIPGFYEFRDLAPGAYTLEVVPPPGYTAVSPMSTVLLQAGSAVDVDLGLATLVPSSGLLEGGIFDDMFVDSDPLSIWFDEKAFVVGCPVNVYDHLGYVIDTFFQPSPKCWIGAAPGSCDRPDLGNTVEITRRLAPGPHNYLGNDAVHPDYNQNYLPFAWNYSFGQGGSKHEADWSLINVGLCLLPDGTPAQSGADCNLDANECVLGTCQVDPYNPAQALCVAQNMDGADCLDGSFCNGIDSCMAGACIPSGIDPCSVGAECARTCNEVANNCFDPAGTACSDDGDMCTDDTCDGLGSCAHTPIVCDDGNSCTVDSCDSASGCIAAPVMDGASCDDGDGCTTGDVCVGGACYATGTELPLPGDATADCSVNIIDALVIAQYTVGLRTCSEVAGYDVCDIKEDGECNIIDALLVAQCTVGLLPGPDGIAGTADDCTFPACAPLLCQ